MTSMQFGRLVAASSQTPVSTGTSGVELPGKLAEFTTDSSGYMVAVG
jgi:hypothetical protein